MYLKTGEAFYRKKSNIFWMVTDNFVTFQGKNSFYYFAKHCLRMCLLHTEYVGGGIWVLSKSKLLEKI